MPTISKFPSSNQAAGGAFNGSWTSPNNAHADDGSYATAAPGKNQEFASVWSVPFSTSDIPNGAGITSTTVEVQWKVSTTSSVATLRSTAFADSAQATAVSASPGVNDTAEPTADTIRTYSATPTLAQLRDLWVRVQAMRGNTNTAFTASLDYVKVTVVYTDPPAGVTGTGSSSLVAPQSTGSGKERFTGTVSASLQAVTSTGTGSVDIAGVTGTGSSSLQPISSTGSGTMTIPGVDGTGSSTLASLTSTGSGTLAIVGDGESILVPIASTASGTVFVSITGTAESSLRALSSTGLGVVGSGVIGAGASSLVAVRSSASGTVTESSDSPEPADDHQSRIMLPVGRKYRPKITRIRRSG